MDDFKKFVNEYLRESEDNQEREIDEIQQIVVSTITVWLIRTKIDKNDRKKMVSEILGILREKMLHGLDECVRENPQELLDSREDLIVRTNANIQLAEKRLCESLCA